MTPRPFPGASPAPSAAEGALRESLTALSNLSGLLRSLKVSPKAVATLIPDVMDGCQPLLDSAASLGEQFPRFAGDPCLSRLQSAVQASSSQLQGALRAALDRPFNASSRLRVEAAVSGALRDLGAMLPLLELLSDVDQGNGSVDWIEALSLSRSGDQSPSPGGIGVDCTLVTSEGEAPFSGLLPRAALNLVRLCAALVHQQKAPLCVTFRSEGDAQFLVVQRAAADGHRIRLLVPRVVDSTLDCLEAAARTLGLTLRADAGAITLSWRRNPHA